MWYLIEGVVVFIVAYLVGRNNPNLTLVNKLIADKKAIVSTAGQIVQVIKKV